jgi:hypothetical protein
MKIFCTIFNLLLLFPLSISAQNTDCERMMRQADALAKNKEFKKAINKYPHTTKKRA